MSRVSSWWAHGVTTERQWNLLYPPRTPVLFMGVLETHTIGRAVTTRDGVVEVVLGGYGGGLVPIKRLKVSREWVLENRGRKSVRGAAHPGE